MVNYDVIIVGGGPAGLLAAGRAAELGAKVLVLEKMRQEGRKLLITGKGRCNVTNSAPISEFIKHVFPDGKFLKKSFSQYYSKDILLLLEKYKVDITLERGGRYFPTSQKSLDILNALLAWMKDLSVEICCGQKVEKLIIENNAVIGVRANGNDLYAKSVIIATGGKSYPATGSTGDGYQWAKQVGHTIEKVRPALVPLETKGELAQSLQGLNLKNVNAVVWANQKKLGEAFGEMIFTHFGLSGPIILTLSRIVGEELEKGSKVEISIDLKPALDEQKLELRLLRDLNEHGKKRVANIFKNWLPSSMIPVFIKEIGLNPDKECHQVSGKERKRIRHMLKNFTFQISNIRTFKEAIITAGGISTNEIKAKTMESKLVKGLYFAGEVLDVDAETGGYNLQIAYSTGWVAGNAAALSIQSTVPSSQ
jgi:hypothetical protein